MTPAFDTVGATARTARGGQYLTVQALRFVAAIAVVVLHSSFYTSERLSPAAGLWPAGANGVRLFFVISGFVMVLASRDLLAPANGWRVFLVKRLVRIVPMYWAATAFKLATMLAAPGAVLHARLDWAYVAKSLFFIPAYNVDGEIHPLLGVGWTLTFEMFFYALFALALLARADPLRFLSPILLVLALLSPFKTPDWPVALQCWASPIVLDFLAGMMLAAWIRREGALPAGLAVAVLACGLAYLFLPMPFARPAYDSLAGSALTTCASTLTLAGAIALEPRVGARIPRAIVFLGAASYALYLIHPLVAPAVPTVLHKLHIVWPHLSILLAVGVAASAGVACHLLIENPATRRLTAIARQGGLLRLDTATAARHDAPVLKDLEERPR